MSRETTMNGEPRQEKQVDLNTLTIRVDNSWTHNGQEQEDFGAVNQDGKIRVYFKDLEWRLCDHIAQAPIVVGCVAWLTNPAILEALSRCDHVSLIVQKEDFLRPDSDDRSDFSRQLRSLYKRLPEGEPRDAYIGIISEMSIGGDCKVEAVRCVGNHNSDRKPAWPRMHNKFLVFCEEVPRVYAHDNGHVFRWKVIVPRSVWTGSFNFTTTGTRSFENALYLTDPDIAQAYFNEWMQIAAFSEPLNWDSEAAAPEWRIGT